MAFTKTMRARRLARRNPTEPAKANPVDPSTDINQDPEVPEDSVLNALAEPAPAVSKKKTTSVKKKTSSWSVN